MFNPIRTTWHVGPAPDRPCREDSIHSWPTSFYPVEGIHDLDGSHCKETARQPVPLDLIPSPGHLYLSSAGLLARIIVPGHFISGDDKSSGSGCWTKKSQSACSAEMRALPASARGITGRADRGQGSR